MSDDSRRPRSPARSPRCGSSTRRRSTETGPSRPSRHPSDDTLPVVLSPEEVVCFLWAVRDHKHRVILTTCYAAGLGGREGPPPPAGGHGSRGMVIHVAQGKGNRDRYVMLSPTLLEQMRAWWRTARPTTRLFPGQR